VGSLHQKLEFALKIFAHSGSIRVTDVIIFKIFPPKFFCETVAFFYVCPQNKAKLCRNLIITLVFEKNADFFPENCDHNIDPRLDEFSPSGPLFA
jgi:hypothetical protein